MFPVSHRRMERTMAKAFSIFFLLALAGCSGMPSSQASASACTANESSYACQVERYHNVNAN
jgi:hypothetical protein